MKKSELVELIREIAQQEFKATTKRYVQSYVPIVIKEVVDELVVEKINELLEAYPKKKSTIKESKDEWPQLGNRTLTSKDVPKFGRSKLASLMGYEEANTNTLHTIVSEHGDNGMEVPISPDKVPEEVVAAMNKDYRSFLKKIDQRKGRKAPSPIGA